MSNNPYRTLLTEMAAELDWSQQLLDEAFRMGNRKATHPLADRARVLLDQHSEPEGVSADEWDALGGRAWDKYRTVGHQGELFMDDSDFCNALDFVRSELAPWGHPTPQPPADGEVGVLVERLKELAHATTKENWREFDMRLPAEPLRDADLVLTRTADLLQRQRPQPVAVSERLPGAKDCALWPGDPEATPWCWAGKDIDAGWEWAQISMLGLGTDTLSRIIAGGGWTHWLPFNALPTPTPEATNDR
jgi:hypothetical protein